MRSKLTWAVCLAAALAGSAGASSLVSATIAADVRYAIYAGAADGSDLALIGLGGDAGAGPDKFAFETEDDRYIYIVAWGHPATPQGLLGEFVFNGLVVFSGDPAWEVYPTVFEGLAGAPGPSEVTLRIRMANRRFAWQKAASYLLNRTEPGQTIAGIGGDAAWMWLAAGESAVGQAALPVDGAVIFRIAPNKLWPEIELWHGRNAGRGPQSGATISGLGGYQYVGGGGYGGGGGASGGLTAGGGYAPPFMAPDLDFTPVGSSLTPAQVATQEPVPPVLPPPPDETPLSTDQEGLPKPPVPPVEPPVNPPDNPEVPEPATALLLLATVGARRR